MYHDNNGCQGERMACFKEEMKRKRTKGSAKDTKQLITEVFGKAQKFCRIGPREFVPFDPEENMTLENIKLACEKRFNVAEDLACDVQVSKPPLTKLLTKCQIL